MASVINDQSQNLFQLVYKQSPNLVEKDQYQLKLVNAVKRLSIIQLLLALQCVVFQAITCALRDYFINTMSAFEISTGHQVGDVDEAGTGIWMGLIMVIVSVIGVVGSKQNRKSLMIYYLALNVFVMTLFPVLAATSVVSFNDISSCRRSGMLVKLNRRSKLADGLEMKIFGENLYISTRGCTHYQCYGFSDRFENKFYCKHVMFQAWITCDRILLVSSVMMFVLSLALLIISRRYCYRACSQSCAGCCCDESFPTQVSVVAYQPQPLVPCYTAPDAPVMHLVCGHPAVQTTSQNLTPTTYSNAMYNQDPNLHPTTDNCLQPTEINIPLPPSYSE